MVSGLSGFIPASPAHYYVWVEKSHEDVKERRIKKESVKNPIVLNRIVPADSFPCFNLRSKEEE